MMHKISTIYTYIDWDDEKYLMTALVIKKEAKKNSFSWELGETLNKCLPLMPCAQSLSSYILPDLEAEIIEAKSTESLHVSCLQVEYIRLLKSKSLFFFFIFWSLAKHVTYWHWLKTSRQNQKMIRNAPVVCTLVFY